MSSVKFTVEVQVTIEGHDDLAERALYHEVDHRGAYSAVLLQCWAAGESSGTVYLVRGVTPDHSDPSDGYVDAPEVYYYWETDMGRDLNEEQLPEGHRVCGHWDWYFNDEAGDQVKIQTEAGRRAGL